MRFKLKVLYYWLKILLTPKIRSEQELKAIQEVRMQKFARKALLNSPFYRRFFKNDTFDWAVVPEITKTEFMASFDDINTQGIKLGEAMKVALQAEHSRDFSNDINGITVGLSTGTNGRRGLFLASEDERAHWVALIMTRVIKPKIFKKQKVAFFLRANSNLYASVGSRLFEFRYFDIFRPMSELLIELNNLQPDILGAQPSVLMDIALAQKNNIICINPAQIISFAEVLTASDKETISKSFDTEITEVYQCTEGFLGASCKYGTIHLNEDFVHFDKVWIDENKFYPVITDFSRHSQPVVKYTLNDVLQVKSAPCRCGSQLLAIEKIIGREDDVLILNNIKVYPDLIARRIAMQTDEFQKYTIEQVGQNTLNIGIDGDADNFESTKTVFKNVLDSLFAEIGIFGIQYHFKNKTALVAGNKTRKIKRIRYED